jgi:hypothetical protein
MKAIGILVKVNRENWEGKYGESGGIVARISDS